MRNNVFLLVLLACASCQPSNRMSATSSFPPQAKQPIEQAREHLLTLGFTNVDQEIVFKADDKNSSWLAHVVSFPGVMSIPSVKDMHLDQKIYWAVYFRPKSGGKGGDGFVFIEKATGRIIGSIFGE